MDCVFAIASYNRPDKQYCAQWLNRIGVPKERIFIQTQTEEDFRTYSSKYGNIANIGFSPASNVSENKNNLLDRVGDRNIVVCSDNVRTLLFLCSDGKLAEVDNIESLEFFIRRGFESLEKYDALMFGVYPSANGFFMKRSATIDTWLLGCFMGIKKGAARGLRFNEKYPLKEDYEISARAITGGAHTVRFNDVTVKKTCRTKGGSYELWKTAGDEVNHVCAENLLASYPDFFRAHRTRKNEVELVKKARTFKI